MKMQREYGKKGLVIVAITNERADRIREFVKKNNINYYVGIDSDSSCIAEYKVVGIPHAFLIDPDGKVVWEGHPESLDKGLIEELTKEVSLKEVKAMYEKAEAAIGEKNYAEAIALLKGVREIGEDTEYEERVRERLEEVEKVGEEIYEEASRKEKEGDFAGAVEGYLRVAKEFEGLEVAERASSALSALKERPEVAKVLEEMEAEQKAKTDAGPLLEPENNAEDCLRMAREALGAGEFVGGAKELLSVVEKFPGTAAAFEARQMLLDMRKSAEIMKVLEEELGEDVEKLFEFDEEVFYANAVRYYRAYRDFVKKWKGTKVAEDFAKRLATMEKDAKLVGRVAKEDAKRECEGWLSMARSYMKNGYEEEARGYLEKILQKYPETEYAEEARRMLAEMDK